MSYSLQPHGLYSPWNSPGQNTAVGSLSFLQGIFPIQGSNPGLPHFRRILYQLSLKGSPRILEWVAYPFSSGSSDPGIKPGLSESVQFSSVAQSCPTLCDPMYYTAHGILQARILEWVAFPFSRGSSQPRAQTGVSHIAGGFFTS